MKLAFFDLDETVVSIKTMFDFYKYYCVRKGNPGEYIAYIEKINKDLKNNKPRELINREYYLLYKGEKSELIDLISVDWFSIKKNEHDFYIKQTIELIKDHMKSGDRIVIVSGSMLPILKQIGNDLNIDDFICAEPESINGILTGALKSQPTIGNGKKEKIIDFISKENLSLKDSFAYGDDISDIPMLSIVDNPVCIGSNGELHEYAKNINWNVIEIKGNY